MHSKTEPRLHQADASPSAWHRPWGWTLKKSTLVMTGWLAVNTWGDDPWKNGLPVQSRMVAAMPGAAFYSIWEHNEWKAVPGAGADNSRMRCRSKAPGRPAGGFAPITSAAPVPGSRFPCYENSPESVT